jgi:hypothetical protein
MRWRNRDRKESNDWPSPCNREHRLMRGYWIIGAPGGEQLPTGFQPRKKKRRAKRRRAPIILHIMNQEPLPAVLSSELLHLTYSCGKSTNHTSHHESGTAPCYASFAHLTTVRRSVPYCVSFEQQHLAVMSVSVRARHGGRSDRVGRRNRLAM